MSDARLIARLALVAALWLGAILFAEAARSEPTRVLILGASIDYGCGKMAPGPSLECDTPAAGYPDRLRELRPELEIRVIAWVGAGIWSWRPDAPTIAEDGLYWPFGIFEAGIEERVNLWALMAEPHLKAWRPDLVLMLDGGIGELFRPFRGLPRPTPEQWRHAVARSARAILRAGATPVMAIGPPFPPATDAVAPWLNGYLREYRDAVWDVCERRRRVLCGPDLHRALVDNSAAYVATDQIHPNPLGVEIMAQAWADWFATR